MSSGPEAQPLVAGPAANAGNAKSLPLAIAGGCCCLILTVSMVAFFICKNTPVRSNVTVEVADELLGGNLSFLAKDMPAQPSPIVVADAVKVLDGDPWKGVEKATESTLSWGSADAKTVAGLMYNVTKVENIWDNVPEMFRGVFWMHGNAIPEELTVLQYGVWSESQLHYLVPMAPFMWAWPMGKPANAPGGGVLYSPDIAFRSAEMLTRGQKGDDDKSPVTFSYAWDSQDLADASLQVFQGHDLSRDLINIEALLGVGPAWATGEFALEAESQDGSRWNRGIKWGIGACACLGVEFGGYTLLKIIDGDGRPVQPHYDDFLAYMGDVPLIVWTGSNGDEEPVSV